MRTLFLIVLLVFCTSARADYRQSRTWFQSQTERDRIGIQLMLVFSGDYNALIDAEFGRRTYSALTSFQNRHRFAPTGILNDTQLDRLRYVASSEMRRIGFEFVEDESAHLTLGVPLALVPIKSATKRGTRWSNRDASIEIETLLVPSHETSYLDLYARLNTSKRTRLVEYSVLKDRFFVITGTSRGKNFYIRMMRTPTDTRGFSFSWAASYGSAMDHVAVAVSNGLSVTAESFADRRNDNPFAVPSPKSNDELPGSEDNASDDIITGTGYIVSKAGHVATNAHVVKGCRTIDVAGRGGASLVKRDEQNDMAVLQLNSRNAEDIARFRVKPARRGETVYVLGYPLSGLLADSLSITEGIVSSLAGVGGDVSLIQITAPVQPGNSGGPVLDETGAVIGTVVAQLNDLATLKIAGALPQNVNFAIRGNLMAALLESAGIQLTYADAEDAKSAADISEQAEAFTVQVLCLP